MLYVIFVLCYFRIFLTNILLKEKIIYTYLMKCGYTAEFLFCTAFKKNCKCIYLTTNLIIDQYEKNNS